MSFNVFFSLGVTLVLSFDDVFFSKGGFLDHKNDILLVLKSAYFKRG